MSDRPPTPPTLAEALYEPVTEAWLENDPQWPKAEVLTAVIFAWLRERANDPEIIAAIVKQTGLLREASHEAVHTFLDVVEAQP